MNQLDEKIYGLTYDPNSVLVFNGEKIENYKKTEGKNDGGKFIVVKREKKSISNATADISVIEATNDRIYPGAIQLANNKLVENYPDLVSCSRKPLRISIDLPGMGNDGKALVESPENSSLRAAIDSLLTEWNNKYSSSHKIATRSNYTTTTAYSESQLSCSLGCNFKKLNQSLGLQFDSSVNSKKTMCIAAFKQIFYTVSVDAPKNPSDLFGDDVTWELLTNKGVNNENPPVYVSSVSYGREIYVSMESNSTDANVKAAFDAAMKGGSVNLKAEYKTIIENSTFRAVILGGNSAEHVIVDNTGFEKINEIITKNAEYSAQNPGYPISYTSVFLKNNTIAKINNKSEYVETTYTEYSNGRLVLDHSGAYVAQFNVSWQEINYDSQGNEVVTTKQWDQNNKDKTAHFSTEIHLPGNARNINIQAKGCTGLAWEWWRTSFDRKNLPMVKERTVKIWGTTLSQKSSMTEN